MKTYRYKDNNGNWIRSIYPKPDEFTEAIGGILAVVIGILFILGIIIYH